MVAYWWLSRENFVGVFFMLTLISYRGRDGFEDFYRGSCYWSMMRPAGTGQIVCFFDKTSSALCRNGGSRGVKRRFERTSLLLLSFRIILWLRAWSVTSTPPFSSSSKTLKESALVVWGLLWVARNESLASGRVWHGVKVRWWLSISDREAPRFVSCKHVEFCVIIVIPMWDLRFRWSQIVVKVSMIVVPPRTNFSLRPLPHFPIFVMEHLFRIDILAAASLDSISFERHLLPSPELILPKAVDLSARVRQILSMLLRRVPLKEPAKIRIERKGMSSLRKTRSQPKTAQGSSSSHSRRNRREGGRYHNKYEEEEQKDNQQDLKAASLFGPTGLLHNTRRSAYFERITIRATHKVCSNIRRPCGVIIQFYLNPVTSTSKLAAVVTRLV